MNLPSYYNKVIELSNPKFPDKLFYLVLSDSAKEAQLFDAYGKGIDISYLTIDNTIQQYQQKGWTVTERKI